MQADWVENEGTYQVNLRWKPAYQATAYDVMRNGEKIGEVTGIVFEDDNLEIGTSYCYQIVAHGEEFETSSNEACVTIPAPVLPCSAPTNLRRGTVGMSIEWTAPTDRVPESYTVVVIDHYTDDMIKEITGITETRYVDADVAWAIANYYKVKAVYSECESEFALADNGDDFIFITNASVDENSLLNVMLYPNPTSGQLSIEAVDMTLVSVYDLVGQCVMQKSAENSVLLRCK